MQNFDARSVKVETLAPAEYGVNVSDSGLPFENHKRYEKTEAISRVANDLKIAHKKFQTSNFKNGGFMSKTAKTSKTAVFWPLLGNGES